MPAMLVPVRGFCSSVFCLVIPGFVPGFMLDVARLCSSTFFFD